MKKIKFRSFSSGSCGNCYFLGIEEDGSIASAILIDAGVSPKRIKKHLAENSISPECLDAVLITHDHADHVRSLGSVCKHFKKTVWMPPQLRKALFTQPSCSAWLPACSAFLKDGWNQVAGSRISVRSFDVPHDATHTVGYAVCLDSEFRFVLITDCGKITPQALAYASQADCVVIESNYDLEMLRGGPYPKELQDRICGGHGHLSNAECAEAIRHFDHDGLRSVFLCHISSHNNTPKLAFEASRGSLPPEKRLVPLPRETASPMFDL